MVIYQDLPLVFGDLMMKTDYRDGIHLRFHSAVSEDSSAHLR